MFKGYVVINYKWVTFIFCFSSINCVPLAVNLFSKNISLNDRHMLRDATFLAVLDENVCLMYASELKCECYLVFLPFFCTGSRFTFPAMVCYLHFDKIFTCALTGLLNSAGWEFIPSNVRWHCTPDLHLGMVKRERPD